MNMLAQSIFLVAIIALSGLLANSNPYGPTYNDASYEQQPSYQPPSYQPSYQPPSYQPSYQPPSYQPSYQPPAYPKYQAPSSAHHTQYDNYYPKQTYSKPMYAPQPKPYSPPTPMYQPSYQPPKPAYPTPSYGSPMEEYKAKA